MKSKYFKEKISKVLLIALLTGSALVLSNNNDIAASVAQDLTVYSGGGGGGPVMGYSFHSGDVGVNGIDVVYYGDNAYTSGYSSNPNILKGNISPNHSVVNVPGFMPGDNYGFGGGVDTYTFNTSPIATNTYYSSGLSSAFSMINSNSAINVKDARFVAGNGGQASDQDFMYQLVNQNLTQQSALDYSFDRYIIPLDGVLQQAAPGSPLGASIGQQLNLEGSMYIKSGALGNDVPFTERTLVNPFNPSQVVVTKKTPRAIGGQIDLYFSSLNVTNNNSINIVRDSASVNVRIDRLEMNSNANVTLESMDARGGDSSFIINGTNFYGGTLSLDQTSNMPVDISGNSLNVMGRNFQGDLVYDLITSPDSLTGTVNLINSANRLVEYRLITSSGTIVIPNTQTTLDLRQFTGVKTIQAVFGFEAIFETNGGSIVPNQTEINLNELVIKPNDPIKAGFIFDGWYIDNSLSNLYDFSTPVTEDVKIFAKWTPLVLNHTFNFDTNGGSKIPSQSVEHGQLATEVNDPSLNNHHFLGWYTDNTFENPYDFSSPVLTDTTVYAKWNPEVPSNTIIHTFSFESNGGDSVSSQYVKDKDLAIKPGDPSRESYSFLGWYTDNNFVELYDFNKPVLKDTSVFAKWENKVTVLPGENPENTPEIKPTKTPAQSQRVEDNNTNNETLPQTGKENKHLKGFAYLGVGLLIVALAKLKKIENELMDQDFNK